MKKIVLAALTGLVAGLVMTGCGKATPATVTPSVAAAHTGAPTSAPEPSPTPSVLSVSEAGRVYLRLVAPSNQTISLAHRSGPVTTETLGQKKQLAARLATESRTFASELQKQAWPPLAVDPIKDLIKELAEEVHVYRAMSLAKSVREFVERSWDLPKGNPAEAVRIALDLPEVPQT